MSQNEKPEEKGDFVVGCVIAAVSILVLFLLFMAVGLLVGWGWAFLVLFVVVVGTIVWLGLT